MEMHRNLIIPASLNESQNPVSAILQTPFIILYPIQGLLVKGKISGQSGANRYECCRIRVVPSISEYIRIKDAVRSGINMLLPE